MRTFKILPAIKTLVLFAGICSAQSGIIGQKDTTYGRLYAMQEAGYNGLFSQLENKEFYYNLALISRTRMMYRITDRIHSGFFLEAARNISTHNEKLLVNTVGLRLQYNYFLRERIKLSTGVEWKNTFYWSRQIDPWPSGNDPIKYVENHYKQNYLVAFVSGKIKLKNLSTNILDIYWSPEYRYSFIVGRRNYVTPPLQRIGWELLRITIEFKR